MHLVQSVQAENEFSQSTSILRANSPTKYHPKPWGQSDKEGREGLGSLAAYLLQGEKPKPSKWINERDHFRQEWHRTWRKWQGASLGWGVMEGYTGLVVVGLRLEWQGANQGNTSCPHKGKPRAKAPMRAWARLRSVRGWCNPHRKCLQ